MAEEIALMSLFISVIVLVVQYNNQRERRHGEISQIRSVISTKLSLIQQRMISSRMLVETARMELRKTRDSEDKYETIERIPLVIENALLIEEEVKNMVNKLEAVDTTKKISSKTLLTLQTAQYDVKRLEKMSEDYEKSALEFLEGIYEDQD